MLRYLTLCDIHPIMKSKAGLLALLSALALPTSFAASASGEPEGSGEKVSSILYTCNLSFKADGSSTYIGVGYTDIRGSGTISCYDLLTGATERIPVKVTTRGPGIGLGRTGLALSGTATGVGITAGPQSLLGRYVMVRGNAAVGIGASAGAGLRVSKGSVSVDVAIEAQSGLGAGIDLLWIDIESNGPAIIEAPKVTAAQNIAVQNVPAQNAPMRVSTSKVIYLAEGQPLEIVDGNGRVLETIYLKMKRP